MLDLHVIEVTNPHDFVCLKLRYFGFINLTDFGHLFVIMFSMFLIDWGAKICYFGTVYLVCFLKIWILRET